jgi:hypothetical protein
MPIRTDGRSAGTRRPSHNYFLLRTGRAKHITTRVTVLQLPGKAHYTPDCGHRAPHIRHVGHLDGPAIYLCRRCWLSVRAAEEMTARLARVRAQLNELFSACPSVNRLRGAAVALLRRVVCYA